MFGLEKVRKHVVKEELDEIGSWLIGQSLHFAAEITARFKNVPQILAASEGLAFYLHALRREAFRAEEWRAWNTIFDPALKQTIQLFAITLSDWSEIELDRDTLAKDVQNLISSRNLEYQTLPFLAGAPDDRQSVAWIASRRVADTVEPAHREHAIEVVHQIFCRAAERDLRTQVEKLQRLLYGRRAA
jgi:hypothetical protein